MIFVTVGAQMPFDRLVRAVDEWVHRCGRRDVFAQIGYGGWRPSNIQWSEFLAPGEFRERVRTASAIVAHAGMGSILTAMEYGKPILVMPRRGNRGETRNDHQVSSARHFLESGEISVAFDEDELQAKLDQLSSVRPSEQISPYASPELIATLRAFISRAPDSGCGRELDGSVVPGSPSTHD